MADLSTRESRLALEAGRRHRHDSEIITGTRAWIGYRRGSIGPGVWYFVVSKGKGTRDYTVTSLKLMADDYEDADPARKIVDYQTAARLMSQRQGEEKEKRKKPPTFEHAITVEYAAELAENDKDATNARRALAYVPKEWRKRAITDATDDDYKAWRGKARKLGLTDTSIGRTETVLKAALNHAAEDRHITDRPWRKALSKKKLRKTKQRRNIVIPDHLVQRLVAECYEVDPRYEGRDSPVEFAKRFGLWVEVIAATGARPSQVSRLLCDHLKTDGGKPRLMMPPSRKGRDPKDDPIRVPITSELALRLKAVIGNRAAGSFLLQPPSQKSWQKQHKAPNHFKPFARAVDRLADKLRAEDGDEAAEKLDRVTIYSLRHSSIVRLIKANKPLRIVAALHNTSTAMIEKHYSDYITDFTDDLIRGDLLDTSRPATAEVLHLPTAKKT